MKDVVLNLSSYHLKPEESSLLQRGLTFIPNPRILSVNTIKNCHNNLIRSIKLKSFFRNNNKSFDPKIKTFINKSTWTPENLQLPAGTLNTVNLISQATAKICQNLKTVQYGDQSFYRLSETSNISLIERKSITSLSNNDQIIIKPADKGGSLVIMDKCNYVFEAERQLSDTCYYKPIPNSIQNENKIRLYSILRDMKFKNIITEKQFEYLLGPTLTQPRHFYLLPKIHKEINTWTIPNKMPPGRPIVSDIDSESYRISDFVNHFLTPLANRHPSYVKNSFEFVQKIRNKIVNKNTLLVTSDITSLYTNMKHDLTLQFIKNIFKKYPNNSRPDNYLLQLLEIILKYNDFEFNDKIYLQICGCPMGKKIGPSAANIYLIEFDEKLMFNFKVKPLLFFRYLDDIFFIWEGSVEELMEFEKFANSLIPGISLKFEFSNTTVNFLDTTIYKNFDESSYSLQTKVFFKTTDTHQLLHFKSFHPHHVFKGILKSQLIRFKRLSSNWENFVYSARILFLNLHSRGYTWSMMWDMLKFVWFKYDEITPKIPSDNSKLLPIIIPFNKIGKKLCKTYKHILHEDSYFKTFKTVSAFSNHKNLQKFLIRNRIP